MMSLASPKVIITCIKVGNAKLMGDGDIKVDVNGM